MISVSIDADRALGMLRRIHGNAADPRALLVRAGQLLRDYEVRLFATSGLGHWAPDDPATIRAKAGGRTLVDTGGLLDDLTGPARVVGSDAVEVTSSRVGGVMAKKGVRGTPKRDPAFVPPASVRADWANQLLDELIEGG